MNNIPVVGQLFICTVTSFGSRNFGFAKYRSDCVYFHFEKGHEITAGFGEDPVFTEKRAGIPQRGDQIIAKVALGNSGWYATEWGFFQEYRDAEGVIKLRKSPKAAPSLPKSAPFAPASVIPFQKPAPTKPIRNAETNLGRMMAEQAIG